jgi:RNA polymerase sigma-70 factor (ECF subfamily)
MKLDRDELQQLFRYGYSLTGNEQDSYDLLHHAIERTMAKSIEPDKPVRYLMRAMRNRFIDIQRREQRAPSVPLEDPRVQAELHGTMDWSEQGLETQICTTQQVRKIWQELQPTERELLYFWAIEEYTASEMAEHTQTSRNTILSRIHRLRTKLKKRFGARHEEAS